MQATSDRFFTMPGVNVVRQSTTGVADSDNRSDQCTRRPARPAPFSYTVHRDGTVTPHKLVRSEPLQ